MRFDVPLIEHAMNDYFRDIQDHVIQVVESIDICATCSPRAGSQHAACSRWRRTDVTKKLTGWAAILSIPLAIASVYGMNFKEHARAGASLRIPHRDGRDLRPLRLAVLRFRRAGWL